MNKPPRSLDEQIKKAMEDGAFDNLPGKGKPMDLSENPFEDPSWRMAFRMLRSGGYSLPWIETRKGIEADYRDALAAVKRTWRWRHEHLEKPPDGSAVEMEWFQAQERFKRKVLELNKRIFNYNLEVPLDQFKIRQINLEQEIAKVTETSD